MNTGRGVEESGNSLLIVEMILSGLLFWSIIIILNLASVRFGYEISSNSENVLVKMTSNYGKECTQ
jgi:hypothetical protein